MESPEKFQCESNWACTLERTRVDYSALPVGIFCWGIDANIINGNKTKQELLTACLNAIEQLFRNSDWADLWRVGNTTTGVSSVK